MNTELKRSTREELFDFAVNVRAVFRFGVESYGDPQTPLEENLRKAFYEDLYIDREHGREEFEAFSLSGRRLLIVTGHVGVGKSSYIHHKFEHLRLAAGIMIDLQAYQTRIDRSNDSGAELRKIIGDRVKQCIQGNLAYYVAQNRLGQDDSIQDLSTTPLSDLTYQLEEPVQDITSGDDSEVARGEVCAYVLMKSNYFDTETIQEVRADYGKSIAAGLSDRDKMKTYRLNFAESGNQLKAYRDVEFALGYKDWVTLYQLLFRPKVPLMLVFDNADSLEMRHLPSDFSRYLMSISYEMSNRHATLTKLGKSLPLVRLVFAVRDQNISVVLPPSSDHRQTVQIALGLDDRRMPYMEQKYIPTSRSLVSAIVRRRYQWLERLPDANKHCLRIFRLALNLWFDPTIEEGALTSKLSNLDLYGLNNSSVRMILEHLEIACLRIMHDYFEGGITEDRLRKEHARVWLPGHIVRTTWSHRAIVDLRNHLHAETEKEVASPYVSIHPLLLTKLARIGQNRSETPISLCNLLEKYFPDTTLSQVKTALWLLYQGHVSQCEFISIRQRELFGAASTGEDIEDLAELVVMPRGIEMVKNIMLQLDYYGAMLSPTERQDHSWGPKILTEMLPDEAQMYVSRIFDEIIEPMVQNYREIWDGLVCPAILRDTGKSHRGRTFFQVYYDEGWSFGKRSHLRRICDAHMHMIKLYISEALKGKASVLFLSQEELQRLEALASEIRGGWCEDLQKLWDSPDYLKTVSDDHMGELLRGLDRNDPLLKLWSMYDKYHQMAEYIAAMGNVLVDEGGA